MSDTNSTINEILSQQNVKIQIYINNLKKVTNEVYSDAEVDLICKFADIVEQIDDDHNHHSGSVRRQIAYAIAILEIIKNSKLKWTR